MAPENGWLEYCFPIGEAYFQGLRYFQIDVHYCTFVYPKVGKWCNSKHFLSQLVVTGYHVHYFYARDCSYYCTLYYPYGYPYIVDPSLVFHEIPVRERIKNIELIANHSDFHSMSDSIHPYARQRAIMPIYSKSHLGFLNRTEAWLAFEQHPKRLECLEELR